MIILSNVVNIKAFTVAKSLQLLISAIATVPAGLIADNYGRKKTIIIACLFQMIYFSLLINTNNHKIILAEIMNGLGIPFISENNIAKACFIFGKFILIFVLILFIADKKLLFKSEDYDIER